MCRIGPHSFDCYFDANDVNCTQAAKRGLFLAIQYILRVEYLTPLGISEGKSTQLLRDAGEHALGQQLPELRP